MGCSGRSASASRGAEVIGKAYDKAEGKPFPWADVSLLAVSTEAHDQNSPSGERMRAEIATVLALDRHVFISLELLRERCNGMSIYAHEAPSPLVPRRTVRAACENKRHGGRARRMR